MAVEKTNLYHDHHMLHPRVITLAGQPAQELYQALDTAYTQKFGEGEGLSLLQNALSYGGRRMSFRQKGDSAPTMILEVTPQALLTTLRTVPALVPDMWRILYGEGHTQKQKLQSLLNEYEARLNANFSTVPSDQLIQVMASYAERSATYINTLEGLAQLYQIASEEGELIKGVVPAYFQPERYNAETRQLRTRIEVLNSRGIQNEFQDTSILPSVNR